ncbi:helix-turn-helix domain-containing protein [Streptomyces phyllanthi]|uniref:XRE family transcriptional regulator n=1 Tax=Streptomyces phyllanthi TaxID=1803180 RepID=A0A5N8W2I5_9ACTN|nr:helix-turn-helix domain-containing protein [Streptomyces phyllanthi]MPY41489.1 XRE family transcriptional regulator [Streptomyces phyllanthi]
MSRDSRAAPPAPPFDNLAARRLRTGLGMEPEHVAYGMRSSYGLPHVTPDLVIDWERGTAAPTGPELTALAGMLWCSTSELAGRPRTLREHRVARGLAPEDVARAVGVDLLVYLGMEETGLWHGNDRQCAALTELLGLSLADFVTVTGRDERLAELLREAVTTRRQGSARPVAKLLSLDRRLLEVVLQELHTAYQERVTTGLTWANGTAATDASEAGRDFLDHIVDRFWSTVGRSPYRPQGRSAQGT